MSHCGYITTLKNVRPHPNADRLVLANCFDNTVCVAKDTYTEGEIGVYFETDLQLSMEFCEKNGLLAVYENGVNVSGGYLDPAKRNIRSIKLRGEASDGLFLPLQCLMYTGVDMDTLNIGDQITVINGHEICQKYIPKRNAPRTVAGGAGKRTKRRAKRSIAPVFFEHKDTEQLQYNLTVFKPGDQIEITLKMHGTSQRTGYLPVLKKYKKTFLDWLFNREGSPVYEWDYISGTRRTVLDTFDGGFYGDNQFRQQHHNTFIGKLWKGITVYYEVVGFTDNGTPIMSTQSNKKVNDKDFIRQYGETTVFSYGCFPTNTPQSDIYVYRMTMTNEDGDVVEIHPDIMRQICEKINVKCVPVLWRGVIPEEEIFTGVSCEYTDPGEFVLEKAKEFYDGPDPIGKTHIREGVVVRVLNSPTFKAYKHKNLSFKIIEGLIKNDANAPDMEEAQEFLDEVE